MENKEVDIGIFRIRLTFYRTGNVHICFVNRITKEEKILLVRNPLILRRKMETIKYAV